MGGKKEKPLLLKGAFNIRDLGGYEGTEGRKLKERQFLRGDSTDALSESDKRFLIEYGVKAVIDLRSPQECKRKPDKMKGFFGVDYFHVDLTEKIPPHYFGRGLPETLGKFYCGILEYGKREIANVWRILGQYPDGCVLFHGMLGKDRTGIIAMTLLSAMGVEEAEILADYEASGVYMESRIAFQKLEAKKKGIFIPDCLLEAPAPEMEKGLAYLKKGYESTLHYLKETGLSPEEIEAVLKKGGMGGIRPKEPAMAVTA